MLQEDCLNEHIQELCKLFLHLESEEECKAFLEDLCTYKEIEQMALRAYAAKLCLEGKTYNEIIEQTELSSATISRVSRCINRGSGGYKAVLGKDLENT
jgi:TrpR-related protein YerC/YecD